MIMNPYILKVLKALHCFILSSHQSLETEMQDFECGILTGKYRSFSLTLLKVCSKHLQSSLMGSMDDWQTPPSFSPSTIRGRHATAVLAGGLGSVHGFNASSAALPKAGLPRDKWEGKQGTSPVQSRKTSRHWVSLFYFAFISCTR